MQTDQELEVSTTRSRPGDCDQCRALTAELERLLAALEAARAQCAFAGGIGSVIARSLDRALDEGARGLAGGSSSDRTHLG